LLPVGFARSSVAWVRGGGYAGNAARGAWNRGLVIAGRNCERAFAEIAGADLDAPPQGRDSTANRGKATRRCASRRVVSTARSWT
jgi:hypothetical protein